MSYFVEQTESFRRLLKDIRRYKPLTKERELSLFVEAKKGDLSAKDEIIYSNILYAIRLAKKYYSLSYVFEDLVSEAMLGLLTAYESFDPSKNVKFISYATWYIQNRLSKVQDDLIHKPETYRVLRKKINDVRLELESNTGSDPSMEVLSDKLNIDRVFLQNVLIKIYSLDDTENLNKLNNLTEKTMELPFYEPTIMDLFEELTESEQYIVGWRSGMYGPIKSPKTLALELKTTTEDIEKCYSRCLAQIKEKYL